MGPGQATSWALAFKDEQELAGPSGQRDGENPGWGAGAGSSLMGWQWLVPADGWAKVIRAPPSSLASPICTSVLLLT